MKTQTLSILAALLLILVGCAEVPENRPIVELDDSFIKHSRLELDSLLESLELRGAVLIERADKSESWSYNDARLDSAYLPASTFKIVNTLIGLDLGLVNTQDTLFFWDGEERMLKSWERDMTLADAFKASCVPCYQDLARRIGPERMNEYLDKFQYGKMAVDSSSIDKFWLVGPSLITPRQQVAFLLKVVDGDLPVSQDALSDLRSVMLFEGTDHHDLYAKTGWSVRSGHHIGWFVGYQEMAHQTLVFATNVEPLHKSLPAGFARNRIEVAIAALRLAGMQ